MLQALIDSVSSGVPASLAEVITLGQTQKKRDNNVLAYLERPGTSIGPTEATKEHLEHLEHLQGSALGLRNRTNYVARSLLKTGDFQPHLHPGLQ